MDMRWILTAVLMSGLAMGCAKRNPTAGAAQPAEVSVIVISPRNTPVTFQYTGQTQSSHQVHIVARVSGFLEKRVYTEGSVVKAGQVMFREDSRPFQATLDAYSAALAEQEARLQVANDNLAEVKPLAALNALSQKELHDATGQQQAAAAAVQEAKANVEQARLNLGYATITTPVTGYSSFARVQEGEYLNGQGTLLTYVDQIDPIWVNFSLSENDMLDLSTQRANGQLILPKADSFEVEVVLANGSVYPNKGHITFANAEYNQQTGTFLLRATLPNPDGVLRPGQFVNMRVSGAMRPEAIVVPQQAVLQGAQGHFVVIVDREGKAQFRPVQVGPWDGDNWFITRGLTDGETVVIDGVMKLAPGAPVKIVAAGAGPPSGTARPAPAAVK
jgi:membrane fusion protein, multidrug efflux system